MGDTSDCNLLCRCCDLTADVVSFSATVSSSGASGKWPTALALFAKMNLAAVLANVIVCNSLVSETRLEMVVETEM